MKKTLILILALTAFFTVQAQWVNNPVNNTFLANTSADAGEIYLATDPVSGDTYAQWSQFASNGWVPKVQRFNFDGEPQWDANGLQPSSQHALASWSQGFAMAVTTDNAVVSCFSTESDNSVAVKINADGTYPWGEAGIILFNGAGGSRTELLAGDDGGVWALATDITNTYLCYIDADGTTHPTITISDDGGQNCTFGLMVPAPNGNVFVVYEKEQWSSSYFYEKDIRVVGYSKNGLQISNDVQLMSPVTIPGSYIHYVVPDGLGGGYVYIWHAGGTNGNHNTYVFHFNQNGVSTIMDLNGIPVHTDDPYNYYLDAYATVDPVSHDLIIVYIQTDKQYQQESRVYANRFNTIGDRLWNEGIVIVEENGSDHSDLLIDAFEYGGGYSIVYNEGDGLISTVKAIGIDDNGAQQWNTVMSSNSYSRAMCRNSTGFNGGQNIVAWVNSSTGGLYGQNIGQSGEMGEITPPTPPEPCNPPTDFVGFYSYDGQCNWYGAEFMWTAPETTPLHYMLYRKDHSTNLTESIEIEASATEYIDNVEIGDYSYQLTAVYDHCESDFALTSDGQNYVFIEVTSVDENSDESIMTVTKVYTLQGQLVKNVSMEDLSHGIYIVQGLTSSGRLVNRKVVIN